MYVKREVGSYILYHGKVTVKGLGPCSSIQVLYYLDGCVKILSLGRFFFLFFFLFFFVIKSLLCLKVQKTHAALAMEIKNL